jgi:hypothetical protein
VGGVDVVAARKVGDVWSSNATTPEAGFRQTPITNRFQATRPKYANSAIAAVHRDDLSAPLGIDEFDRLLQTVPLS